MRLVATAGHVDHGKSTLVQALTGVDPDRWDEEKVRGMTIDLGFAAAKLPSGAEIEFIDVPGHVRFLRNMLAGVGSVRACLFVVDATEGWKPQSEEHLRILELVGVASGVVALTKVRRLAPAEVETAASQVVARAAGTFLEGAPVVPVDAPGGIGLDALRAALEAVAAVPEPTPATDRPRLWIDRSFAIRGSGTVVTGTLTGGEVRVGDPLDLLPRGVEVRVRGLQRHGSAVDVAVAGVRLALNLSGVSHRDVARGDVLVRARQWAPTAAFDASLTVLSDLGHPVTRRGAYVAYIGSREAPVRVRLIGGRSEVLPGETGFARLHLATALPLLPGDRYVLREAGRGETVGGGEVLDVDPVLPARAASPSRSFERVVAERGWVDVDHLERLTGERVSPTAGRWVASPAAYDELADRLRAAARGTAAVSLGERERAVLPLLGLTIAPDGTLREGGANGSEDERHPYLDALDSSPFAPPTPEEAGCSRADLRGLLRRGLVVERDGLYFSADALEMAARAVAKLLAEHPEGISASAFRECLGTSRKYAIPLLEHLDASGVTRRRGDVRVAGPRLPTT